MVAQKGHFRALERQRAEAHLRCGNERKCADRGNAMGGCTAAMIGRNTVMYIYVRTVLALITPRACARGKAIGTRFVRLSSFTVVVGTKIARSRVLGVCVCCKHNQSVDIGEKLVCTGFELLKKAY